MKTENSESRRASAQVTVRMTEDDKQLFRLLAVAQRTEVNNMVIALVREKAQAMGVDKMLALLKPNGGAPATDDATDSGLAVVTSP